jgi:hypothetical protein
MTVPCCLFAYHLKLLLGDKNNNNLLGIIIFGLQLFLLYACAHYAMNGDSAARHGAQALHIISWPIYSGVLCTGVIVVCKIVSRAILKPGKGGC